MVRKPTTNAARVLKGFLKEKGIDVKHQVAVEAVARLEGFASHDVKAASAKSQEAFLRNACQAALDAFRQMYEALEEGAEPEDIMGNEAFWPLRQLREALQLPEPVEPHKPIPTAPFNIMINGLYYATRYRLAEAKGLAEYLGEAGVEGVMTVVDAKGTELARFNEDRIFYYIEMSSESFGSELFTYDTAKEREAGLARLFHKVLEMNDPVPRDYRVASGTKYQAENMDFREVMLAAEYRGDGDFEIHTATGQKAYDAALKMSKEQ